MDGFPSLVPSRRRFSCRMALFLGIALWILCVGIGCGDFTLFGEDEEGVCNPDPCASKANAIAGTCTDLGDDEYSCGCQSGYFWDEDGNTCEDPCASDPCDNIENAVDSSCEGVDVDDYTCDCVSGYFWKENGNTCQDPCASDPCDSIENAENGSCEGVDADDFTCECDTDYIWNGVTESCEIDPCNPDPCDGLENAVDGTCTPTGGDDYTCDCETGFIWIAQINQCGPSAVGTCDDLEACLLNCNGFEDSNCQYSCYATWTGCDCDLDFNELLTSCGFICLRDCPLSNPFTKACWDCVIPCGFDSQCQ